MYLHLDQLSINNFKLIIHIYKILFKYCYLFKLLQKSAIQMTEYFISGQM